MPFLRQNLIFLFATAFFASITSLLIWKNLEYYSLFPLGLFAVYAIIYHSKTSFLSLAFLTPLSINIEEYTDHFGLFIPTEPILFGFLLLMSMLFLRKPGIAKTIFMNEIVWVLSAYLIWIFITCITSSHVIVSFKFLLAHSWFIVPLIILGSIYFQEMQTIKQFIWLFLSGMTIVIVYTLIIHASYQFGEDEGHWVMWPFFKDHTIYGAIVAYAVPLVIGLYFSKKHTPLVQSIILLLVIIMITGLYFSYTRAAWLSVMVSFAVWIVVKLRIKFRLIAGLSLAFSLILVVFWDQIQMELERNKSEHTTEQFGERLQSATNVTTDASNLERINRWSCAIEMFKDCPVFGFGPGTYAFEYARFQSPENLTIISTNFGNLGNAHSEYLGALAETGLLGFLLIIMIVGVVIWKALTLYNKWPREDKESRTLLLAMVLSLVSYFFHGILNNYLDTDKAAVPVWATCAMIIAMEIIHQKRLVKNDNTDNSNPSNSTL